jgi:hypothetical protein
MPLPDTVTVPEVFVDLASIMFMLITSDISRVAFSTISPRRNHVIPHKITQSNDLEEKFLEMGGIEPPSAMPSL